MSVFGTAASQSVSGATHAERASAREKQRTKKAPPASESASSDAREPVDQVELADPVRAVKDNDSEEAREDHEEHPAYSRDGTQASQQRPRLDLEG